MKKFISNKHHIIKLCIEKDISLSSSVSNYGTKKFENYKKDESVMKKKYLDKKISEKEFENWINCRK